MQAKKKTEKKHQTFHHQQASYLVELQPRVTQFKLSLPRALQFGPSPDASQKKYEKKN
jgi:hypothetical protein